MFNIQVPRVDLPPTSVNFVSPNGINEGATATAQPGVEIGDVSENDTNGDPSDSYTYLVDDPRFQVVADNSGNYHLYLKPGLSLSYMDASQIPINITAVDSHGLSVTDPFTVNVNQVVEPPTSITGGGRCGQPAWCGRRGLQTPSSRTSTR